MKTRIVVGILLAIALISGLEIVWLKSQIAPLGVNDLAGFVYVLGLVVVGILIMIRRPENRLGWLFTALGTLWALSNAVLAYANYAILRPQISLPTAEWMALIGTLFSTLAWATSVTFVFLLFPDGQLPSPRWRIVAWVAAIAIAVNLATSLVAPGPVSQLPAATNPLGQAAFEPIITFINNLFVVFFLCVLASMSSIFLRLRQADLVAKKQIKWVAYFGVILALLYLLTEIIRYIAGESPVLSVVDIIGAIVFAGFPLVIGFAILYAGLWDIDVVIRKTLVYGVLTVSLGFVFFGSVLTLQQVFSRLTGTGDSPLIIVLSTLAIAALFSPLRRRIQDFIDRRFYRRKYDAEQALAEFAQAARNETDLEALTGKLVEVVSETMQPEQVSWWLKSQRKSS